MFRPKTCKRTSSYSNMSIKLSCFSAFLYRVKKSRVPLSLFCCADRMLHFCSSFRFSHSKETSALYNDKYILMKFRSKGLRPKCMVNKNKFYKVTKCKFKQKCLCVINFLYDKIGHTVEFRATDILPRLIKQFFNASNKSFNLSE